MKKLAIILLAVTAFSCTETINLDPDITDPVMVIEGLITNESKNHFVRISRSTGFNTIGSTPTVDNAIVSVSDDQGGTWDFVHNPGGDPDSVGYYLSDQAFAGIVGRTYSLSAQVDGVMYSASDLLTPLTKIDSLGQRYDEQVDGEDEEDGFVYETLLFMKEPQGRQDNYLFEFYRNGQLQNEDNFEVYVADDEALAEAIEGLESPVNYKLGDTARVDMYSLSRDGFWYYWDLATLVQNDGGMFSPPPANPRTNLSNGAVGYFQASSIETKSVIIVE